LYKIYLSVKTNTFISFGVCLCLVSMTSWAQNTPNDGDWSKRYVVLKNTPEAEWMIRLGDVDNLGFGWEAGFDPFSGAEAAWHSFPWETDPQEILGMDMILTPSSTGTKEAPCSGDGYSGEFQNLLEKYGRTTFPFHIPLKTPEAKNISAATMMLFIDDFQAPVFCSKFEVLLNNRRAPFLESIINSAEQSGPIGKLITVKVPDDFLNELSKDTLHLFIDDPTTAAADGFAVDFIKILINPKSANQIKGGLGGIVVDDETNEPIEGASISVDGIPDNYKTDAAGKFSISNLPAGLNIIKVNISKFGTRMFSVDVIKGKTNTVELRIKPQK